MRRSDEVLARFFLFVGQWDQRGIADCFARAYLALFGVTAELVGGVGDWKGLATRRVTLGRDPERWAVLSID